jgi:hypothetical protein
MTMDNAQNCDSYAVCVTDVSLNDNILTFLLSAMLNVFIFFQNSLVKTA